MKIYEATANVHVPLLKHTCPIGTRFTVDGNKLVIGDDEYSIDHDFKMLIKCGLIKELSEQEAATPENVVVPKTMKSAERQKMAVTIAEDLTKPIERRIQEDDKPVAEVQTTPTNTAVRGMKVNVQNGIDLKADVPTAPKKELTPEQEAKLEATKQARIAGLAKAREVAKANREAAKANETTKANDNTPQVQE